MTPGDRSAALFKLANLIEADMDRLAPIEVQNQGKTIKQARDADIPFSVDNLRFMAGAARTLTGLASTEYAYGATSVIRREPIGVVGQITPWNYPFMMAIWKLAPALAAGNTAVLKPASLTPLTTLELGKFVEQSGIPAGVVNLITGPGPVVGKCVEPLTTVTMGAPRMRPTDRGPPVSPKQREKVEQYVEIGADEGAKLALAGKRPNDKAFARASYYEPTAFVDTDPSMRIA